MKSEHENFTAYRNTCQIESDLQLDWDIQVDEHPVKQNQYSYMITDIAKEILINPDRLRQSEIETDTLVEFKVKFII